MWFRNMGKGPGRRFNFGCGFRRRLMGCERRGMGKYFCPSWCDGQKSGYGKEAYGPGWWKRLKSLRDL